MFKNNFLLASLIIVSMLLSACQPKASPASESPAPIPAAGNLTNDQIITIGIVSDDPAAEIENGQPFADYMAKQLNDLGIMQGSIVVTPDIDTMVAKLKTGEVDLYYESPYGSLQAYKNAGAIPLLRGWRKGVDEYHSAIYVKKDSGINSINELQGELIGFSEQKSTTGHFLPKAYLISSGLTLSEQSSTASVPNGEVGYLFTGSPENMITALLQGKIVAGAEEGGLYDALPQEQKDQVVVLAQTQDVPRSLMMASPLMSSSIRQRIFSILQEAANTDDGTTALKAIKKTAKFDELPLGPQGTMEFLQNLFAPVIN